MFGCCPHFQSKYEKQLKRLIYSYKQRDTIEQNKRSVFYCLLWKILTGLTDVPEAEALKILAQTPADIMKLDECSEIQKPEECARILIITKVAKLF